MDKRYRVVPPLRGVQPASAFLGRIYMQVPAGRPDHRTCYEGERCRQFQPKPSPGFKGSLSITSYRNAATVRTAAMR
jgi:hypothetical protein